MSAFQHRVEYFALRGLIAALSSLPWDRACRIGEKLGRLGYRPFGIRRNVVERQIAAAFPELSAGEVEAMAARSYAHLARSGIEVALLPRLRKAGVLRLVSEVENWHLVENAQSAGRGLIIVAGHLGNWELSGAYLGARDVPTDAIVRGMANKFFDAYLNRTREELGMTVVHDSQAVRRTPRSLQQGRAVAFVADQGVLGLASTYVPFFGRPAKTPRGAAVFALRFNVPVIFIVALRKADGSFHVAFEQVPVRDTGNREADVDGIVLRYTEILEKWVRRAPEQYFWQHRRWRRQPPDTPAALRDPVLAPG